MTLTELFINEALRFIRKNHEKPFFFYLPHTAPHFPVEAHPDWKGKSKYGEYGDMVEELDARIGEVIKLLEELKLREHTINFLPTLCCAAGDGLLGFFIPSSHVAQRSFQASEARLSCRATIEISEADRQRLPFLLSLFHTINFHHEKTSHQSLRRTGIRRINGPCRNRCEIRRDHCLHG